MVVVKIGFKIIIETIDQITMVMDIDQNTFTTTTVVETTYGDRDIQIKSKKITKIYSNLTWPVWLI